MFKIKHAVLFSSNTQKQPTQKTNASRLLTAEGAMRCSQGVRDCYLHSDLRESWSRKLWSFFTALMSRGNSESGEESKRKIGGYSQASCSTRHKCQLGAQEEETPRIER